MNKIEQLVEQFLLNLGVNPEWVMVFRLLLLIAGFGIIAFLLFWITSRIVIRSIYKLFRKTSFHWDDVLADHHVFRNVAHLIPAVLFRISVNLLFHDFDLLLSAFIRITDIYIVIVGTIIVLSILKSIEHVLSDSKIFADKPIASYFQLLRIIIYVASFVLVLSILLGKSPVYFLSAFGAISAVILLIFKDTLMGLVASVQIASNDMVRVGDWVEMPKFNADGDVIAINLNTVKVRNWDKTVTTIPTYYFITDSFKNWRGMQESGGRRIKRSIHINVRSIRFVDPEERERYKKIHLITDYISKRQQEIETYNTEFGVDTSQLINGRRMTNLGVFRRYVEAYLRNSNRIRQDMTLLVRQLAIEDRGIPIEVYCFTNITSWVEYEEIQSDIFDHLLAAASHFGLQVFQKPGGSDFEKALIALGKA